ncbi:MAG TPA: PhoX family phosphatase, partial [Rubrivivax sp.]|nr:PhoX family phosphatase [Rubrivivax sp.]
MAKDFSTMEDSNRSTNASIHEVSDPRRRRLLQGSLAGTVTSLLAPLSGVAALAGCATTAGGGPLLGFKSVPVSTADTVVVPEGYSAQVIAAWGEPVGLSGDNPAFKFDASNTA